MLIYYSLSIYYLNIRYTYTLDVKGECTFTGVLYSTYVCKRGEVS